MLLAPLFERLSRPQGQLDYNAMLPHTKMASPPDFLFHTTIQAHLKGPQTIDFELSVIIISEPHHICCAPEYCIIIASYHHIMPHLFPRMGELLGEKPRRNNQQHYQQNIILS